MVGNPFTCDAVFGDNRSFYRMNAQRTALVESSGVIHPMEGVFVEAANAEDQSVTFVPYDGQQSNGSNDAMLTFSLAKNRGVETDRASIRFGEGQNLGKLELMASPDKLYIPQNGTDYAVVFSQPVGELPLNFEASENGTYSLSFEDATEGLAYCHLIDNLTGNDIDLLQTPSYAFDAHQTDYASRFRVVFVVDKGFENGDFAFVSNGRLVVNGEGVLQVIDVMGRVIASYDNHNNISISEMPVGVYVLRLIDGENVKIQKIVVR